jgi:two-component system chemotaxis response regulator CheY
METNESVCDVLIVDDDNDLCRILEFVITDKCSVHVEHSLDGADHYLADRKPDIILLDNNLPDGLGVKAIKHMLQIYPEVKIVLMTADDSKGLQEMAMDEGAAKFIAKPFQARIINDVILSLCPPLRAA